MRTLIRTLIAAVLTLSVAGTATATLVTPADAIPDEANLYYVFNQLYGTGFTSNATLVSTYGIDTEVIPITENSIVTIEVAWMNAYYSQDIGVYTTSGGAPDYSVLAPMHWSQGTGLGDLRGQGFVGSFTTPDSFYISDRASNPGDVVPGNEVFTWYTEAARNLPPGYAAGDTHMIVFSTPTPGTYMVSFEDLPLESPASGQDYNDFFIEIRVEPVVPEPATMALLGLGLAGLVVRSRKSLKR